MARSTEEAWDQISTRIPNALRQALRLHCVKSDISVMEFVARAIAEKLAREGRHRRQSRS